MENNFLINIDELPELLKHNFIFIDLRTPEQYNQVHLQKFINIPYDNFKTKHFIFPIDKPIYLICHSGKSSFTLAKQLRAQGYLAYSFAGGIYAINHPINHQYY